MAASARKQRETEALRQQVLDKAEEIFVQEGIERVTMRRIAASVDYAPTVLYRLFANKGLSTPRGSATADDPWPSAIYCLPGMAG